MKSLQFKVLIESMNSQYKPVVTNLINFPIQFHNFGWFHKFLLKCASDSLPVFSFSTNRDSHE